MSLKRIKRFGDSSMSARAAIDYWVTQMKFIKWNYDIISIR